MLSNDFIISWLRLALTKDIGSKTFFELINKYSIDEAIAFIGSKKTLPSISQVEDEIAKCHNFNGQIILACDPLYPDLLQQIADKPPFLMIRGNVNLLRSPKLAVVNIFICW